jgi:hypothetical protein
MSFAVNKSRIVEDTVGKEKKRARQTGSLLIQVFQLFARRLNIHVDLLRTAASEDPSSKHKESYQNHQDENRNDRYNACTSPTFTLGHGWSLLADNS